MQKYGLTLDQLSAHGQAAAQAAERMSSRTTIYREKVPVAAIVPVADLDKLEPADPGEAGEDPLLALCGTCNDDAFVDTLVDLSTTVLFRRGRIPTQIPPATTPQGTVPMPGQVPPTTQLGGSGQRAAGQGESEPGRGGQGREGQGQGNR
jgi:hypothetical protein